MISIIVPIYNVEGYVEECIKSLINQTYKEIEIVLVDDCSTDSSGQICDRYANLDERIKVIHQETNKGVSTARNTGMEQADRNSKWFMFVDGDDSVAPELCEKAIAALQIENGIDTATWGYTQVKGKEHLEKRLSPVCLGEVINQDVIFDKYLNTFVVSLEDVENWFVSGKAYNEVVHSKKQMSPNWRFIFSREIIEKNNIRFNTKVERGEDLIFNFCYLQCCKKMAVMDCTDYYYQQREGSLKRDNVNMQKKVDFMEALEEVVRYTPDEKKDCLRRKWLGQRTLIVMNSARLLARNEKFFKGFFQFKKFAKHPVNREAVLRLDISKAPFKYKVAIGMIKKKLYFIFFFTIYMMKVVGVDFSPMD